MTLPATVPERIIGAGASSAVADAIARHGLGEKLLMVCDEATWAALGKKIGAAIPRQFEIAPHSLARHPQASMELIPPLLEAAKQASGLLAVGSGTINDITKYAAHELKLPYIAVAT